uniref:hypothetical protein n=1 Tax=Kocuria rhizophila TaxID=72000 RepID=UPI001C92CA30
APHHGHARAQVDAGGEDRGVGLDLVGEGAVEGAEGVDVLGVRGGAEVGGGVGDEGEVEGVEVVGEDGEEVDA